MDTDRQGTEKLEKERKETSSHLSLQAIFEISLGLCNMALWNIFIGLWKP
jgi:hypothetical protein